MVVMFTNHIQVQHFSAQPHIAASITGKHERHYREVGGGVCNNKASTIVYLPSF